MEYNFSQLYSVQALTLSEKSSWGCQKIYISENKIEDVDQKVADTGDQTKNEFETLETKVEESQIKEKIDK